MSEESTEKPQVEEVFQPVNTEQSGDVVIHEGETVCANNEQIDVYETRRVLAQRIKKYVKPIVYKIERQYLDNCGNVVDVVVEQLDESLLKLPSAKTTATEPATQVAAQSVASNVPRVRRERVSFADLNPDWVKHNLRNMR